MNHISRYVQGTVWHWSRGTNDRFEKGVQGDDRPVLVISNNVFNMSSPAVNCLTITSVLKDSPVHVPVHLYQPSHIQCEQIHTIRKQNLVHYKGTVSENTLKEVKEKLKFQLNIDNNLFNDVNNIDATLKDILEEIRLGLKDSKRDMYMVSLIRDLLASQANLTKQFITFTNSHHVLDEPEVFDEPQEASGSQPQDGLDLVSFSKQTPIAMDSINEEKQEIKKKREYRKYTDEDILFIVDEGNTPEDIMNRFGLDDKTSAYNLRNRMKKKF